MSAEIPVVVDARLKLREADLSPELAEAIGHDLIFDNPDRIEAQRQGRWGWTEMPATVDLITRSSGGVAALPRGYAARLRSLAALHGQRIVWEQDRQEAPVDTSAWASIGLRPHQAPAIETMMRWEQGIYQAPPGSGKTVCVLELARRLRQRTCIVVDKANIAKQWIERAEQFLGITPALFGDGSAQVGDITIAMQQTLRSRIVDLQQQGWFEQFGLVVLDEMHHVSADTYSKVMQSFPARYRFGVSATPDRYDGLFAVSKAVLGSVIFETPKEELRGSSILVLPTVVKVYTGFEYDFWPKLQLAPKQECPVPDCKRNGTRHGHNSNFPKVESALQSDVPRAAVVAAWVNEHPDDANLVISRRLGHLRLIYDALISLGWEHEDVLMLTGQESSEERMQIAARAERAHCAILSTIADEALDIPRLDRLYLAWPTKNPAVTTQRVGRIERSHPDKKDAIVFDFIDALPLFDRQFGERRRHVYAPSNYPIIGSDEYMAQMRQTCLNF